MKEILFIIAAVAILAGLYGAQMSACYLCLESPASAELAESGEIEDWID